MEDVLTLTLRTGKKFSFKRAEEYIGYMGAIRKNRELFSKVMRGDTLSDQDGLEVFGFVSDILKYNEDALEAHDTMEPRDLDRFLGFMLGAEDGDVKRPKDRAPKK